MSVVLVELSEEQRRATVQALQNMLAEFGSVRKWEAAEEALQALRDAEPTEKERVR